MNADFQDSIRTTVFFGGNLRKSASLYIKNFRSFRVDIRMDLEHVWGVKFGLNDLICLETGMGGWGKGFNPSNPER